MTQQPKWKLAGHVGDVDPIAHGGGFVYIDETGVYGPEMTWFETLDDGTWERLQGETPVTEYRIMLDSGTEEWWYEDLYKVVEYCGGQLKDYREYAVSSDPMVLANLYADLISYHSAYEFDQYPSTYTEDQEYERYKEEMSTSLSRR